MLYLVGFIASSLEVPQDLWDGRNYQWSPASNFMTGKKINEEHVFLLQILEFFQWHFSRDYNKFIPFIIKL